MPVYKAIIFDLGNVLFEISFIKILEYWGVANVTGYDELAKDPAIRLMFEKFERGEMDEPEFRKEVMMRLGFTMSDEEFDKGWCNLYLDAFDGVENLVRKLKTDYRVVGLSNTNSIHQRVWEIRYGHIMQHFEKVFSSHLIRASKPEPNAFNAVLDYLQLPPNEIVFLDDNKENILAAEKLGIKSIHVLSAEQMIRDLEEILK